MFDEISITERHAYPRTTPKRELIRLTCDYEVIAPLGTTRMSNEDAGVAVDSVQHNPEYNLTVLSGRIRLTDEEKAMYLDLRTRLLRRVSEALFVEAGF